MHDVTEAARGKKMRGEGLRAGRGLLQDKLWKMSNARDSPTTPESQRAGYGM